MYINADSSGTTTTGFGPGITFAGVRNGDGVLQQMAQINVVAEVNSGTTLSSGFQFMTATAGANTEKVRISYNGGFVVTPAAGGHAVFNEGAVDADFRVESDGNANMLTVDASANSVLVGTSDTLTSRALFVKVNTYPQQNYATNASINYPTLQLRTAYATGVQTATQIDFRNGADASVGTIQSTVSSTSYNTSSDQRLKENIADADDAGSKIDAIQVRQFDWKIDGSHQDYGMVAQELQAVAPEAVSAPEDLDEMMSVDYSKLVPMMLKEIQSLRARVADLEL